MLSTSLLVADGSGPPNGGAGSHSEPNADSDFGTNGSARSMAVEAHQGAMVHLRSPRSPVTGNHATAGTVNPDASRSFAGRDSSAPARHGPNDRDGSFW
jgi:hypothetical protein